MDAHGRQLRRVTARRAQRDPRRRACRRRRCPSRLRRRGALGGPALRLLGRSRQPRAHDLRVSHRRPCREPELAGAPLGGGSAPPQAGHRGLVGAQLRLPGAVARPCGLLLRRLLGVSRHLRQGRRPLRRQRAAVLRAGPRRGPLRHLHHHPPPDRPVQGSPPAVRAPSVRRHRPLRRRRGGGQGRPDAGDGHDPVGLRVRELHPAAAAGRRRLRPVGGDPREPSPAAHLPPPALRPGRHR